MISARVFVSDPLMAALTTIAKYDGRSVQDTILHYLQQGVGGALLVADTVPPSGSDV